MQNKINLILFCISLLVAGAGGLLILTGMSEILGMSLVNTGLNFAQILALLLLAINSTIAQTKYFRGIQLFIAVLFVGAAFKIMHWKSADTILLASYAGLILTYIARFANKKNIGWGDIFKVLWVVTALTGTLFILFHWPYGFIIKAISIGFLLLAMGHFTLFERNKKDREKAEKRDLSGY